MLLPSLKNWRFLNFYRRSLPVVLLPACLFFVTLPSAALAERNTNHPTKQNNPVSAPENNTNTASISHKKQAVQTGLNAEARLTGDGPIIRQGLQWRVYSTNIGLDNKLPLVAQSQGGSAKFFLNAGDYLLLVNFGRAEQSRTLKLEAGKTITESFNLNAGGVKLSATLPDGKLNEKQLHFTIYTEEQLNEQKPLIENVKAGDIIRLPAGTYHIVCNYGNANAITRSDVRIEAGKLTQAAMQQRAAQIILKLVRQKGGEALADTNWAIMNDSGDIVRESANANAYIILAEGNYVAVAKNKDQIYQKEFSVSSGRDEEIEVPATPQNNVDEDGID